MITSPSIVDEIRKDKMRDEFTIDKNNFIVDTCNTYDCGWETAIQKNYENMVVVQEYPSKEEATKGHAIWVDKVKKNPNMEIKEIRNAMDWAFGGS